MTHKELTASRNKSILMSLNRADAQQYAQNVITHNVRHSTTPCLSEHENAEGEDGSHTGSLRRETTPRKTVLTLHTRVSRRGRHQSGITRTCQGATDPSLPFTWPPAALEELTTSLQSRWLETPSDLCR